MFSSSPQKSFQAPTRALTTPSPLKRQSKELISYQEPVVPLSQCPRERNQLNVAAFQSGQYPLPQLFVIVKQNGQSDQQAGVAC